MKLSSNKKRSKPQILPSENVDDSTIDVDGITTKLRNSSMFDTRFKWD
jgi:hypothetical protein